MYWKSRDFHTWILFGTTVGVVRHSPLSWACKRLCLQECEWSYEHLLSDGLPEIYDHCVLCWDESVSLPALAVALIHTCVTFSPLWGMGQSLEVRFTDWNQTLVFRESPRMTWFLPLLGSRRHLLRSLLILCSLTPSSPLLCLIRNIEIILIDPPNNSSFRTTSWISSITAFSPCEVAYSGH